MARKKYTRSHDRKVRGAAVHGNKKAKERKEKKVKKIEELKGEKIEELAELEREELEATYLTPEIENFIETDSVKEIEDRVNVWIKSGYPVHIIGPTGCGKTTVAMKVAKDLGRPVVWINGDEQVTTTDLIGGYSQVEAETLRDKYIHNVYRGKDILKADWVDNPLTLACKYGYTLVYNEFSRTKPAANNILLSVLEEGILELPTMYGKERYVKVHPDFNLILTSNPIEYAGVHRPQDALLDRTIGIYMDFYDALTEVEVVKAHTRIEDSKAKEVVKVIRRLRTKLSDAEKPGTRACIMVAKGLSAYNGHSKGDKERVYLDILATKVKSPDDLSKKRNLIKQAFKGLT